MSFSGSGVISQIVTLLNTGKQPLNYYFCIGQMPRNIISDEGKKSAILNIILVITIITHVFGYLLIQYNKRKNLFNDSVAVVRSFRLQNMDKQNIFRLLYFLTRTEKIVWAREGFSILSVLYKIGLSGFIYLFSK
jgi:hypothetical protein